MYIKVILTAARLCFVTVGSCSSLILCTQILLGNVFVRQRTDASNWMAPKIRCAVYNYTQMNGHNEYIVTGVFMEH